jgi:hypothetical protein
MHTGRKAEAIVFNHTTGEKERVFLTEKLVESCDIQLFGDTFHGEVPAHHRIGVEGTLHRISLIVHPTRSVRPPPPPSHRLVLVALRLRVRSIPFHRVQNDSRDRCLHAHLTR